MSHSKIMRISRFLTTFWFIGMIRLTKNMFCVIFTRAVIQYALHCNALTLLLKYCFM